MSSFFSKLRGQAQKAVDQHGDKIAKGLDRAASEADKRTKGKYSDKIAKGRVKAQEQLAKMDDGNDGRGPGAAGGPGGPTGPAGPTGPPRR
ncbi:antitoxin [uncultured Nocardioides sp.]|uniref:antitoxin n=1 Tax=uncultured Nocardioides sp. TaxID=198441 RepID=UPI0026137065|nr:antitoxin [uncultured Nocardioides sp.]